MAAYRLQMTRTALWVGSICWLAGAAQPQENEPRLDREQILHRMAAIQPTAKELRFDAIGWASDIQAAEKLAKARLRPVFLFSNVGQMDIGRC
jgi:hypothetical protein